MFGLPELPAPIDYRRKRPARRLLIVEDDLDTARFVQRILEHHGFDGAIESDGDARLERIRRRDDFDVVVCNYMMPGQQGDEVVQRLRVDPRTRNLPVVMLTGQAGASHVARGMEAGADDYVTKPFDPLEFIARVRAALRRRVSNEN
jgi:two-component system response regulator MtrA